MPHPTIEILGVYRVAFSEPLFAEAMEWKYADTEFTPEERKETEKAVRECARSGACSIDELAYELGVGAGCGRCRDCASEVLREARTAESVAAAA